MFITTTLRATLLIMLVVAGTATWNAPCAYAQETTIATTPYTEVEIVDAVNKARANEGLSPLTINAELTKAAQLKAEDMVQNGYFAHISPSGVTPWHWFDEAGYYYIHAGENLASGFNTTRGLMNGWLTSPTHKANIMGAQYTETGIGIIHAERNGKTVWFVVETFGSK